jgi:uncharacterized membrane protein YfcA
VTGIEAAAGAAVLAAAGLQAAVGFGFSLVCAPLVFAAFGPVQAVGLLTILALVVNSLSLLGEGRRPRALGRLVAVVLAWSVPGMVAGVYVLRNVDARALQIALTVVVFVALAVQLRAGTRREGGRHWPPWGPPVAGLASGALTTTTSTGGPPLVLLLLGRDVPAIRVRDTLAACFLFQGLTAAAVLAATGTRAAAPHAVTIAALLPLAALGQLAGRRAFHRLAGRHYEWVLIGVLTVSAIVGLASALG